MPVDLTRAQAQRLAELELSDPAYRAAQPSLVERAIRWLVEWVQRVADRAAEAAPGGWLGILGLVLLIVVAVLFIRWRIGPVSRSGGLTFTVDPGTSAAQYRAHADELAGSGQWDQAVSERMRALVRGSQERGLIDAHPGWTADEVAARWARRVPDARDSLDVAARTFDEVRYGGRPGSPAAYRAIADADDRVAVGDGGGVRRLHRARLCARDAPHTTPRWWVDERTRGRVGPRAAGDPGDPGHARASPARLRRHHLGPRPSLAADRSRPGDRRPAPARTGRPHADDLAPDRLPGPRRRGSLRAPAPWPTSWPTRASGSPTCARRPTWRRTPRARPSWSRTRPCSPPTMISDVLDAGPARLVLIDPLPGSPALERLAAGTEIVGRRR